MHHPYKPIKIRYKIHYQNVVGVDILSYSCLRLKCVNFRNAYYFNGQLCTF